MKKHVPLLPVLLCVLLVVLYFAVQKTGMFIDEIYTLGLSNGFYTPFITDLVGTDSLLTRQEMLEYLTVSGSDAFRFDSVWYNQTRDVHPPLHYLLIHAVSSLFPGSAGKWIGIVPNIALLLLSCALLYLLALESFSDQRIALLGAALYGLSTIAVSTAIMVRMYMLLTLLTLLLAYQCLRLIRCPRRRSFPLIGLTILLGLLTQYYFVFYAFFLCAACCVYLLLKKRWQDLLRFALWALGGVGIFCLVYPACFDHLFAEKLVSGGSVISQLLNFSDYPRRLHSYVYSINFYTRVAVRTGIIAAAACLLMAARLRSVRICLTPLVLILPAFAALFFIAVASPVIPLRYVYHLIPLLVYTVCYVVHAAFLLWGDAYKPVRIAKALAAPAAALLSLATVLQVAPEYLYPEHAAYTAAAEAHADAPCVYFNDGYISPLTQDLLQLTRFPEVFVTADPDSGALAAYLDTRQEARQLVVYIDIDPDWSSGFDPQTILSALAPDWTAPELLYRYGSSETYLLTRAPR